MLEQADEIQRVYCNFDQQSTMIISESLVTTFEMRIIFVITGAVLNSYLTTLTKFNEVRLFSNLENVIKVGKGLDKRV
jgi:hypothetical protein